MFQTKWIICGRKLDFDSVFSSSCDFRRVNPHQLYIRKYEKRLVHKIVGNNLGDNNKILWSLVNHDFDITWVLSVAK